MQSFEKCFKRSQCPSRLWLDSSSSRTITFCIEFYSRFAIVVELFRPTETPKTNNRIFYSPFVSQILLLFRLEIPLTQFEIASFVIIRLFSGWKSSAFSIWEILFQTVKLREKCTCNCMLNVRAGQKKKGKNMKISFDYMKREKTEVKSADRTTTITMTIRLPVVEPTMQSQISK